MTVAAFSFTGIQSLILMTLPESSLPALSASNSIVWLAVGLSILMAVGSLAVCHRRPPSQNGESSINQIGPYVLLEEIGRGGMGTVFRAEHGLMKRQCAIKLISPGRAQQSEMQNRFRDEARATARLTHWNTIEVYDYGTTTDGRFYYVMEYLEGVNLHQFVERFGRMPADRVVYLLKQLSHALYEAASHHLVHRDIKPSNVFLSRRGESFDVVKLLDFGLVQTSATTSIRTGECEQKLHGSPAFMCPEQARGMRPDHRGDMYSLGAVAYFLLSGHPPFRDDNPIMQVVAHATDQVPSLASIGVQVEPEVEAIVMQCLEKEPDKRFCNARELLLALEQCQTESTWDWSRAEQWWKQHQPSITQPVHDVSDQLDETASMQPAVTVVEPLETFSGCPADTPTEIGMILEEV